MAGSASLDEFVARSHVALGAFVTGDPEPLKALWSQDDDVTVGNPFGPFALGWNDAAATMERAATRYRDGETVGFDEVARYVGAELACLVEVERYRAKVGGADELVSIALRVSSVMRLEAGAWRIVSRHADPIATAQPPESVIER